MFSELPKLFDKSFAVGFFLPAVAFGGGMIYMLAGFGYELPFDGEFASDITRAALAIWLLAVAMLALNRPLVRFLEGYGDANPLSTMLLDARKDEFQRTVAPTLEKQDELWGARLAGRPDPQLAPDFADKLIKAVSRFPHAEEYVLATRFGNIMRAFEVYSHVVYGIDAVTAWPRLVVVLPQDVRGIIQDARSLLDFALNMCFAAVLVDAAYISLALWTGEFPRPWIVVIASAVLVFCWLMARDSALQWGEQIKSAFDMHRALLAEKLGLVIPSDPEAEREMWLTFSRMVTFRSGGAFISLKRGNTAAVAPRRRKRGRRRD